MAVALLVMWCWFFVFPVGSGLLAARKRRSVGAWVVLGVLFGLFAFVVLLLLPALPAVDPARPHRYLLGIECDGQVYHGGAQLDHASLLGAGVALRLRRRVATSSLSPVAAARGPTRDAGNSGHRTRARAVRRSTIGAHALL